MLDTIPAGIIILDEDHRLVYISRQAKRMLGEDVDGALGKPAAFFIDDALLLELITSGDHTATQSYAWRSRSLMVTASSMQNENLPSGSLLLLQAMVPMPMTGDDINRLKGEFDSLMESSYDGIILADADSILNVNASFGRITGVAPSLLKNRKFNELDTAKHICLASVQEVIRLTRYHKKSLTLQRKLTSGNEIFVTGSPVFDPYGHVIRVLLNVRDVTELKSLEDQIKNISNICEDADQWNENHPKRFQGIVAESPAMRLLLDLILRVSRVDSTVLLQGASGVGKDVFARLLHRLSDRSEKPFVAVNCGAIPEALLESEFFGYEKGAFTSADSSGKAGLFEQANHGVLFLDEVGDLPLNLQVKFLKVLQDRYCRRVGGTENIDLDVRIVAATNRDLRQMVSEGHFRVRERQEDILPLSLMFLNQYNQKYKVNRTFGHELMSVLETYEWPGNVRELQNVVERMVVTADTDVLIPRHLPKSIHETDSSRIPNRDLPNTMNLKIARETLESALIKRAVSKTGSTRKAAKLLGVDHSTVIRKAQRYGLDIRAGISQNRQGAGDMPLK
jgi:PAS domain S-box-containing protein